MSTEDSPAAAPARHAVRLVEAAAPGFALAGLRDGPIAVTDDGRGVATQVVSRLLAAGIRAAVHRTVPTDVHGVICLGGLGEVDAAGAGQPDACGAVAGRPGSSGGVFVAVQDTGGDFGIEGRSRLAELTRTVGRQWPDASVKAIACERGNRTSAAIAAAIVHELLHGGSTVDVGLRADGTRTTIEARPAEAAGEIQIDAVSHPYLADHTIEGTPVIPLAMTLEWFTAAAGAWAPGSGPVVLRNVRVLRRIALENFAGGGDRLRMVGSRSGETVLLELRGDSGARHYRATTGVDTGAAPAVWTVPAGLEPVRPDVYDGQMLFHGPRFQALQEVEGISDAGGAGVLLGAAGLGWGRGGWQTDPAAVDGGLQLAVLWAQRVLGRATLPMGLRECRTYRAGLCGGPARCVVRAHDVWSDGAECDIAFLAPDGTVRAELSCVSLVPRPS